MEKKKTYLYIYVCMAALLFVGAAISLSVGSAEIGIIGSIKLALSGIPGIGQFVDISAYSTMQRYIILQGRPHDYLWLGTAHPSLIYQQMTLAYERGIQKMWILNVGEMCIRDSFTFIMIQIIIGWIMIIMDS